MPSVNPPGDGGYQYYHKQIGDLEEELKAEAKKARQNEQEAIQNMESRNREVIAARDQQTEDTVRNIRENANDVIERERLSARNDIQRIKNETYDKWGRFGGVESDVMRQQLDDYRRGSEQALGKAQRDQRLAEQTYAQRSESQAQDYNERLEKAVTAARDSANETYSNAYRDQASAYQDFKTEAQQKYEELNRQRLEELATVRRETEKIVDTKNKEYERRAKKLDDSMEERSEKLERAYSNKMEDATRNANDSRESENRLLRRQVAEVTDLEKRYTKERGQGTQDAIQEYEDEFRHREEQIKDSYEREIVKLKADTKDLDRYLSEQNDQNLREKDLTYTTIIQRTNADNHRDKKDIEATFNRDRDQLVLQNSRDREQSNIRNENSLRDAALERDRLLENQARSYQDVISRNREQQNEVINSLEKELTYRKTSDDTDSISPAAENSLRKTIIGEYEKILSEESKRNARGMDSLKTDYTKRLADTVYDKEMTVAKLHQQNTEEGAIERSRFLAHIQDTEYLRDEALRSKDYESNKAANNLSKNYATTLERQKREFDAVINAAQSEAAYQINALRQKHDFETKMTQRRFNAAQSDLVRDYDKKLSEQKQEYETQISDLKSQLQVQHRENERTQRKSLEELTQSYEQRLAQTEYQRKERERYMTENFQEQLERVKRSNALLTQKKG